LPAVGYLTVIVLRSFMFTQYQRVTDGRTDGLKDRQKCCS